MAAARGENRTVDVVLLPSGPRSDEALVALRDAAEIYGWRIESSSATGDTIRIRVVPGTCTRRPEALRVVERVRAADPSLVRGVDVERGADGHVVNRA